MLNLKLPVWLKGPRVTEITQFLQSWWALVEGWLAEPLKQIDPDTCSPGILDLIAAGRNVKRFEGEPLALYRLRVKYAFVNAVDAGSVAGLQRIFVRLGIGYVEVLERQAGKDWDVIILQLSNAQLSGNQELLKLLLTKYGRTCRRYEFNGIVSTKVGLSAHLFNIQRNFYRAQ
ncbi:MAG: phage tail protein [Cellvibrionaceae bacterium]